MVKIPNHLGGDAVPVYVANNPFDISLGFVLGRTKIPKMGYNGNIGTDIADIDADGGIYAWPQFALALEAISTSDDDIAGGSGATMITVEGLDSNFAEVSADIAMAGTVASAATPPTFFRTNGTFVKFAGTYGGANAGTITIREAGGGNTQAKIVYRNDLSLSLGQTQIGRHTVPAGKTAFISAYQITVQAQKVVTFFLWQRQNADVIIAPFAPRCLVDQLDGISDRFTSSILTPLGPFPEKSDLWWMGVADTGMVAKATVSFQIVQVQMVEQ